MNTKEYFDFWLETVDYAASSSYDKKQYRNRLQTLVSWYKKIDQAEFHQRVHEEMTRSRRFTTEGFGG
jgi:hypothetical protein